MLQSPGFRDCRFRGYWVINMKELLRLKKFSIIIVFFFIAGLISCKSRSIETPSGFAVYKKKDPYIAISPDSVKIRISEIKNEPYGSLPVLIETMKLHFQQMGYVILSSDSLTSQSGMKGHLVQTKVQTLNGTYRYSNAIFMDGNESIILVETGGPEAMFLQYEKDILSKIKTVKRN